MKLLQSLIIVPVVLVGIAAAGQGATGTAAAYGNNSGADSCVLKAVGKKNTAGNPDSRWTIDGNKATVQFTLTGTDCATDVTIASWKAPDGVKGRPYSEQKLYKYHTTHIATTGSQKAATGSLSVELPDCYYQVDLVPGASPTDKNGGPQYKAVDGRPIHASLHGGTQKCEETPVTPVKPAAHTDELPHTGAGANLIVVSVAVAVLGAIAHRVVSARKLYQ